MKEPRLLFKYLKFKFILIFLLGPAQFAFTQESIQIVDENAYPLIGAIVQYQDT